MSQQQSQPVVDIQDILLHTKAAHAALDKAKAELEEYAQMKEACRALAPAVYTELLRHRRIDPAITKEAAERVLLNPVEALNILIKAANPEEIFGRPEAMGKPAATKPASGNIKAAAAERDADVKYRNLATKLGLSV